MPNAQVRRSPRISHSAAAGSSSKAVPSWNASTTHTLAASLAFNSFAMVGNAMLAMALSSWPCPPPPAART